MIAFFDTETTGFPNTDLPVDDPKQARCVQLAVYVTDRDGVLAHEFCTVLAPEGITIPAHVAKIHGISQEVAEHFGMPRVHALRHAFNLLNSAELCVAHNFAFDDRVLNIESVAHGLKWDPKKTYCTMMATTEWCKLPKARGAGYKWPKMMELYQKVFLKEFEGAHDAGADTKAMVSCFFELKKRGILEV